MNVKFQMHRVCRFSIVVFLALGIVPALIAESHEDEQNTIEVVVTADRVISDLLSTAAHVSIITAEDIRESGATNVVQLLERQAGINFRSFSNEAQATVDMRGFGEGSQGRVLVLVDGRRQNNPDMSGINWLGIPIDSIERIEVLRGSASALYGNHAVGGVINILSKTPQNPVEVTGFGSFGSWNTNQQRLGLLHRGSNYRLRGSAEQFSTDGYRERSAYQALNFSLGAEFDPSPATIIRLGGRYARLGYELPGSLTEAQFNDNPRQATNPEDEGRESVVGIDAGFDWFLGDNAVLEVPLGYTLKNVEDDTASFSSFTDTELTTLLASPALILEWSAGGFAVRSRVGIDAFHAGQTGVRHNDVARTDVAAEFELSQWSLGTVLSNTVSLGEQVDVHNVLRYEVSEISGKNEASGVEGTKSHGAFVFDLGAVYRPTEWSKVYLTGGTLYRYPALDEQASIRGFGGDAFNPNLDPERGGSIELGGSVFPSDLLRLDANVYVMQLRDEIAFSGGQNVNLDETRRFGGDLQLTSFPIPTARITAGYSYVNAQFIAGANSGNQIPLVPQHSFDGELGIRPLAGLEFGPAVTHRGESFRDQSNTEDPIAAYFLMDLFMRYRLTGARGDLSVRATLRNVLDESYAPLIFFGGYYPAPGRNFEIAASFRY